LVRVAAVPESVVTKKEDSTMAHKLAGAAPAITRHADLDRDAVWQARVDLAACFRAAARLGLHEGICNHLSAMVPGRDDLFLVNPYGWGFSEVTASRMLVCDFHGNVVAGSGEPEATAFYIHARVHMNVPRARAAFHTHMPNATALAMLDGPPLSWSSQSSLKFYGRTLVDDEYNGLALDEAEGDRIAASIGDADVVFMKNHGIMVVGGSIAEAWDDLYYLERACEAERLALSTGRKLKQVPAEMAARTYAQMRQSDGESARLHLESIKRQLDRDAPDYRH
jgi:ribulose-5-phosphate 4-epimerase/fuculose-1-phosphate aldolase